MCLQQLLFGRSRYAVIQIHWLLRDSIVPALPQDSARVQLLFSWIPTPLSEMSEAGADVLDACLQTSPILLGKAGLQNSHPIPSRLEPPEMHYLFYFSYVEHTSPIFLGKVGLQNSHPIPSCPEPPRCIMYSIFHMLSQLLPYS